MQNHPVALELPLWLQLNKVAKKYMDALASRLGHLGIKRHYFLLVAIGEGKGELTQQDLADLLETDKVAMVGILDQLSKKGFVRRTASRKDRRKHLIALTPKGERALPGIKTVIAELNQRALSALPAKVADRFPIALLAMKSELEAIIAESREDAPRPPPSAKPGRPAL
jgi:DNA-binding MarR family transcriptional regulator